MLANCLSEMVTAAFSAFSTLCNQCSRDREASQLAGWGVEKELKDKRNRGGRADFPVSHRDDNPENYWQSCIALEIKEGVNTLQFSELLLYRNLLSVYGLIAKCLKHLHNRRQ